MVKKEENKDEEKNKNERNLRNRKNKTKTDKVSMNFNFIINGWNVGYRKSVDLNLLCYVNDCRKHIDLPDMTEEDEEYENIKFIKVWHFGVPKVFGITIRDIKEGEELMTYFGSKYSNTMMERKRFRAIQKVKKNDMIRILQAHDVTDIDI